MVAHVLLHVLFVLGEQGGVVAAHVQDSPGAFGWHGSAASGGEEACDAVDYYSAHIKDYSAVLWLRIYTNTHCQIAY